MYARFIVSHYHTFVRFNGEDENRVILPNCELDREFVADPFLFVWRGNIWLFFEGMYKGRGDRGIAKGVIGCFCYQHGSWKYIGVVLEESYHVSYPQIFEEDGNVYMIPETAQAGKVILYEAVDFPLKWQKKSILISGKYVDSTLLRHDGHYYMVATPEDRSLHPELWHSNSLIGPWVKHVESNNVSFSHALRRNGGAFIVDVDGIFRIAQDCDDGYGIRLYKIPIERVSEKLYSEGMPDLLQDVIFWSQSKMHHTYNRIRYGIELVEVIDCHYNSIRPPVSFLVAMFWYFVDGTRYIIQKLVNLK
jgi:hypothetical protein